MINFEEIKNILVEKGLAHEAAAIEATQQIVFVEGEWNRDGSATINDIRAGWVVGDFPKVISVKVSVPEVSNFDNSPIVKFCEAQFPGAIIKVKIN